MRCTPSSQRSFAKVAPWFLALVLACASLTVCKANVEGAKPLSALGSLSSLSGVQLSGASLPYHGFWNQPPVGAEHENRCPVRRKPKPSLSRAEFRAMWVHHEGNQDMKSIFIHRFAADLLINAPARKLLSYFAAFVFLHPFARAPIL